MNRRAFLQIAAASTVVAPSLQGFAATAGLPYLLDVAVLPGLNFILAHPRTRTAIAVFSNGKTAST